MANIKVSALGGVSGGLASGDKILVTDASDLSASFSATLANVATFVNTAPVWAAGTASAGTWPKLTAGTLLTTPEAGAFELNSNCLFFTITAGNRGVIGVKHFIRQVSSRALTSTTSLQQLFNSVANGTITLGTGTWMFRSMFYITGLSATSGNLAFNILGAGTATLGTILYHGIGVDNTTLTNAATRTGSFSVTAGSVASMMTAGTGTGLGAQVEGTFVVTAGGTLIPSVALVTAAAGTVAAGSYFMLERIGSTTIASRGNWV